MINMFLHKKDIQQIQDVLTKFPDLEMFKLEQENHSGIGSITTMVFDQEINGLSGSFKVEIAGIENW